MRGGPDAEVDEHRVARPSSRAMRDSANTAPSTVRVSGPASSTPGAIAARVDDLVGATAGPGCGSIGSRSQLTPPSTASVPEPAAQVARSQARRRRRRRRRCRAPARGPRPRTAVVERPVGRGSGDRTPRRPRTPPRARPPRCPPRRARTPRRRSRACPRTAGRGRSRPTTCSPRTRGAPARSRAAGSCRPAARARAAGGAASSAAA